MRTGAGRKWARVMTACLGLVACAPSTDMLSARVHLVDRMSAASGEAIAFDRIGGEGRPVLHTYASQLLAFAAVVVAPSQGPIRHRVTLRTAPAQGQPLIVQAFTRRIDGPDARPRWQPVPSQLVEVQHEGANPTVELRIPRPRDVEPGEAFELRATAQAPLGSAAPQVLDSVDISIPTGAVLEFGFGVADAARQTGPVEFSILACEEEDCDGIFSELLDPGLEGSGGWLDRRASLEAYAGEKRSLRFTARAKTGTFSLPLWGDPSIYVGATKRGPNLILISLDTLRADHLPSYGYERETAPFIEARLARRGVLFERATTSASTTGPSHITLFTSLQPSVHRLVENSATKTLPRGVTTLAEAFRAAGFATGAVTENGAIAFGTGIERGFSSYREVSSERGLMGLGDIESTVAHGRRWLERNRDKRSFLFLHSYQVHTPYEPPKRYRDMFPEPIPGREAHPQIPPDWHPDLYDREIRFADDALAAFFEALEAQGLLEDSFVVVTSDHGEAFLEHDYLAHGAGLHQEILHVPLFFTGPGLPPGARVDASVGLVDLMPTLLELLGVDPVEGLMGRSFAPLVRGRAPDRAWSDRPMFSEAWRTARVGANSRAQLRYSEIAQPSYAVRRGDRKLIRYRDGSGFRYAYYDLANDPDERQNLYSSDPTAAQDLRSLIEDYVVEAELLQQGLTRDSANAPPPLDPEREERLRALGYLQ